MSYTPKPKSQTEHEVAETLLSGIEFLAKLLMWLGLAASLASVGFLVYYVVIFSGGGAPDAKAAQSAQDFIELFRKILTGGLLAFFLGSAYLFWGEGWMEAIQILTSVGCYAAPIYFPMLLPNSGTDRVALLATIGMQRAGLGAGIVAAGVLVMDVILKVQTRMRQGIKADQLKYGKGIKEEIDRKNVFMGKCWQLPYCRKFVRERCPIYHAKRSCWREKVGCMCEEEVIKGAMENRAIPKDAVAAARYIPQNNKITLLQKIERCRQCVIYNEHQKHKYRLLLPIVLISFLGLVALLWGPLNIIMHGIVGEIQRGIEKATMEGSKNAVQVPDWAQQVMLACICLILLAYALKLLEFLIFKLKV
jgi:hypothetical protein